MLDHSECAERVIFEFKEPIVVIEGSGPLQERHWLELIEHRATRIAKIDKELVSQARKKNGREWYLAHTTRQEWGRILP